MIKSISRLWSRLGLVILALVFAATTILPANAKVYPWTPKEQTIITTPKGTSGSSTAFFKEVCKAIKAAPSGAKIQVATYWTSDSTVVNCLLYAKKTNHVNVSFVTWDDDYKDKQNKKLLKKLKSALGTNTSKASYFKVCQGSCFITGKDDGTQHAKIVTISEVKKKDGKYAKNIVFISSANFSKTAANKSWNYTIELANRPKLYAGVYNFINQMKYDKAPSADIPTVTDGDTSVRFYPGGYEPIAPTLKKITSAKVPTSYGTGGKAKIRVVMYFWMGEYKDVAKQLCRLKTLGADVGVVIKEPSTGSSIKKILKNCDITTYNSEQRGRYSHGKVTTILAKIDSDYEYRTYAGSVNFTAAALNQNTEIGTQQNGKQYFDRAVRYYDHIKQYSGKAIY